MVTAARPALYDVGRLPMLLVTSAMCYINLMWLSVVGLLLAASAYVGGPLSYFFSCTIDSHISSE